MSGEWRTVRLAEVLTPVKRPVMLEPDVRYGTLGVRLYGKGAFAKASATGSSIAARSLNRVQAGDVVYSKLFAWRGAFAVIPADLDGALASTEFPSYAVRRDTLLPEFFRLWASRVEVWMEVESACTGTTTASRNRLAPADFLDLEIELPPLEEQARIVAAVDVTRQAQAALELQMRARERLYQALVDELVEGDEVSLGDVVAKIDAGASPRCLPRRPRADEWGVLSTAAVRHGTFRPDEAKALPSAMKAKEGAQVSPEDLLTIRASGTKRLVGALCIVPVGVPRRLMSDYHWRLSLDAAVDSRYLMHATAATDVRAQIDDAVIGSTTAGKISRERYLAVTVPLPDLPTQRDVAAKLDVVFDAARTYRTAAERAGRVTSALTTELLDERQGPEPVPSAD
jgi:type I restriction enzyme, S subunit